MKTRLPQKLAPPEMESCLANVQLSLKFFRKLSNTLGVCSKIMAPVTGRRPDVDASLTCERTQPDGNVVVETHYERVGEEIDMSIA